MTPAKFIRMLWGDQPRAFVQLWRLRDRRSWYLRTDQTEPIGWFAEGQEDVYTGVALAGQDHGRYNRAKANQAVAIPGLWLDIDVNGGPGDKGGAAPTIDAAVELARTVAPPTLIINSGYGIHAWHLFDEAWRFQNMDDQAAAATAATQWAEVHRRRAVDAGFSIDRLSDLARLLRPPGSINAKGGTHVPVEAMATDGPRAKRSVLLELAAEAGDVSSFTTGASSDLPQVDIGPARALGAEVLEALIDNSPEFRRRWTHTPSRAAEHWSLSEYDLALCSIAAQAGLVDQQLADLIALHRRTWDPTDEKGQRRDYVQRTVAKARQSAQRAGDIDYFRRMARPAEAAA